MTSFPAVPCTPETQTNCCSLCALLQAKSAPALIIVKTYDEPVVIYDGEFKHDPIVEFIEEKTAPVLVEMDQ